MGDRVGVAVKTIVGLLPLAAALAGLGAAIWWLLAREMTAGRWLLAAVLVGHGLVHLMFLTPTPASASAPGATEWPFDMAKSWLATGPGLDLNLVRLIGGVLVAVVILAFALAGLSTVGLVVPSDAWRILVSASAVVSAVLLTLFFNPQLVLGLGIDALLVGVAVAAAWTPAVAAAS
jgi:hypothetical protein